MADPGLGPAVQLRTGLRAELHALPGVVQTLGLLPLPQAALVEATERALATSPVLERADGHPCPGCGRHVPGGLCRRCRQSGPPARDAPPEVAVDPFRTLEAEAGAVIRSAARRALRPVIDELSPRGLLESSAEEIARRHGLSVPDVTAAIEAVRAVGPPGITAPDLTTMLVAQARVLTSTGAAPAWFPVFVQDHLAVVAQGDLDGPALALGVAPTMIEAALELVRRRLRPFAWFEDSTRDAPPRLPDVLVHRSPEDQLEVEVPGSAWFGLRVVDLSAEIGDSGEARSWLAQHERAARQLVRQIDARADVLARVTALAVTHQRAYLQVGDSGHRPLTRTAVANELGLHPSTVSRAVRDKWLRLPAGQVVELARLFGKGVAARAALRLLLDRQPTRPSDARLQQELAGEGTDIARRTVTKYRHGLHCG